MLGFLRQFCGDLQNTLQTLFSGLLGNSLKISWSIFWKGSVQLSWLPFNWVHFQRSEPSHLDLILVQLSYSSFNASVAESSIAWNESRCGHWWLKCAYFYSTSVCVSNLSGIFALLSQSSQRIVIISYSCVIFKSKWPFLTSQSKIAKDPIVEISIITLITITLTICTVTHSALIGQMSDQTILRRRPRLPRTSWNGHCVPTSPLFLHFFGVFSNQGLVLWPCKFGCRCVSWRWQASLVGTTLVNEPFWHNLSV